ncbi:MAG: hypothetical protein HGB02_08520 [Chlorobiaceae bacterium]|nr:hypothetical protein [Chlorobiaceae bacterium]
MNTKPNTTMINTAFVILFCIGGVYLCWKMWKHSRTTTCEHLGGPWEYQITNRDNRATTFTNDQTEA